MLVYKENEALKQENRMLRDKVAILDEEINRLSANRPYEADFRVLQDEVDRLNRALMDKDRQMERQAAEQKNEWADAYGAQTDQLQKELSRLSQDNDRLRRKLELGENASTGKGGGSGAGQLQKDLAETAKRLKKRELECQALWETLKDLKDGGLDVKRLMQAFAKRALETKAHRKLELDK